MVASSKIKAQTRDGGTAFTAAGKNVGSVLRGRPKALLLILILVSLVAVGALVSLFRHSLGDIYSLSEERVITAVGLGVAPLGVWLVALLGSLVVRPRRVPNLRLWASTLALSLAAVAAMSAFETSFGSPLDAFTRQGEVSLGGDIATYVTRGSGWLAFMFAGSLVATAVAIVQPILALRTAQRSGVIAGRLGLAAYSAVVDLWSLVQQGVASLWGGVTGAVREFRISSEEQLAVEDQSEAGAEFDEIEADAFVTSTAIGSPEPLEVESPAPDSDYEPNGGMGNSDIEEDEWETGAISALTSIAHLDGSPVEEDDSRELSTSNDGLLTVNGAKVNRFWNHSAGEEVSATAGLEDAEEEMTAGSTGADERPILDKWAKAWSLPNLSMLVNKQVQGITRAEMNEISTTIRDTLGDYGVEVEVKMTQPGPAVTMYGLEPGWVRRYRQENATDKQGKAIVNEAGRPVRQRVETKTRVKVDTILQREKDLALALRTPSIRIESPVMGTSLVGIEVPNAVPELVTLRNVMESSEFKKLRKKGSLPIALGKGSGGDTAVLDLARLPHLLVAGATGSGKSVCLNTIVSCLTMEKSPSELRLLLVDPKRVELTPYNGIPHLLTPVVVETDKVVPLLKALIAEMFKRYRHLEQVGVRNISSYNAQAKEKMPYLVLVVDELADLMMTSSFDVEQSLCRLAQLGRATGIHLVIATQRPSVDVLTGLIKANFPSRIAFGVTSQVDSRTILDSAGAEKLLGRGDMLYQPIDASRPSRVQGVFISDEEVRQLVEFWKTTKWAPLPAVGLEVPEEGDSDGVSAGSAGAGDDLMDRALELAHKQRKLSTSLLQRRLRIGYPRAARLMDELEEQGIVGPSDGSKSRDVIID
jgi:DNA segregation ATPase FtsK/SpoIIIE-like protein